MLADSYYIVRLMSEVQGFFSVLLLVMFGVVLLCYTIAATMAQTAKQQDDTEQLALKFSHKK